MKRSAVLAMFLAAPSLMTGSALFGTLSFDAHGTEQLALGYCTGSATVQCMDFDWTGTATGTPPVVQTGTVDGTGDSGLFDITNSFAASNGALRRKSRYTIWNPISNPLVVQVRRISPTS